MVISPRLCGLADEACTGAAGQIELHRSLGLGGIELRTVDGLWLHELSDSAFAAVASGVRDAGLAVPCVASSIGGWRQADPDDEMRELECLGRRAPELGCPLVRVMSYERAGRSASAWRRHALDRLAELARRAEQWGLRLVVENCTGWAGDRPARMVELVTALDGAVGVLFDIGNGVWYGYDSVAYLQPVLAYVEHVHLKDATRQGEVVTPTFPGRGSAAVVACLARLADAGYGGWISVEPHLQSQIHAGMAVDGSANDAGAVYRDYVAATAALIEARWPEPGRPR